MMRGMATAPLPAAPDWLPAAYAAFSELIELEEPARAARLAALATESPVLHAGVLELFAADQKAQAHSLLEGSPPVDAASLHSVQPGSLLGPYRLLRPLGEGGMGTVWLAERADGLYSGQVALKMLHPWLSQPEIRERFAREGRYLARLTHPHIARLLDAGVNERQLYLVLEYVEGERLDHWCDARRLGIKARLQLFLQVCEAVSAAHAALVVHRDLKPGNILVTAGGTVKLLDFGIAKLVESESSASERTELTRLGAQAFTLEYAAPEQLDTGLVTTATDVHALGALLYLLLCGQRPFGEEGASAIAMQLAILRDEAMAPSRRLTPAAGAMRGGTQARLQAQLRGDLDNISARALQKNPRARYASVAALADDLRRHLAYQPVLARRESRWQRTQKFVRRNRLRLGAALAVSVSLAAGVAGIWWQAERAQAEAQRAEAVRDFLVGIFERNSVLNPEGAQARQATAEQLLALGAEQIGERLRDQPRARADLLATIGRLYAGMSLPAKAVPLLRERLALVQADGDDGNPLPLATAYYELGEAEMAADAFDSAGQHLQAAVDRLPPEAIVDARTAVIRAGSLIELARILYRSMSISDRRPTLLAEEAVLLLARHAPRDALRVDAEDVLALLAEKAGDGPLAEQHYRRGMALDAELGAPNSRFSGYIHLHYGDWLRLARRYAEAEPLILKAQAIFLKTGGDSYPHSANAERFLARLYADMGRKSEALAVMQKAVATAEASRGVDDAEFTAFARANQAALLYESGQLAAALAGQQRAEAVLRAQTAGGYRHLTVQAQLARTLTALGRGAEARALLLPVLASSEAKGLKSALDPRLLRALLAEAHLASGDTPAARQLLTPLLAAARPADFLSLQPWLLRASRAWAEVAAGQRQPAAALPLLLAQQKLLQSHELARWLLDERAHTALRLASGYCEQGQHQQARAQAEEAARLWRSQGLADGHWLKLAGELERCGT